MNEHVTNVSESDFQQQVVDESNERLVLVDFWAPWCGPCRSLTPVLEKLAADYGGRFLLAKVNSDDNQNLAREFGVRGIPNVKAFYGGKMIDEFTGAMPEGAVRQFIDRLLPSSAELQRQAAMRMYASGNPEEALSTLEDAQALEPENDPIRIDRAEILIDLDRTAEAADLLNELKPLAAIDDRVQNLKARLTFASSGAQHIDELKARVDLAPQDLEARLSLAKQLVAAHEYEPALRQLLEITRADRSFGDDAGRKTMLAVFELIGNDHPLTGQYRRQLAAMLN